MTPPPSAIPPASGSEPDDDVIELDLRGLRCPMPVLRTRKALAGLGTGTVLRVLSTDPLSGIDIPHLVHETGDILVRQGTSGTEQHFLIRRR